MDRDFSKFGISGAIFEKPSAAGNSPAKSGKKIRNFAPSPVFHW